ncbi:FecR family protein [Aestuariibaculum lutulentum]|uniref:FecR domain-containing protein n=1 Tax=Aestuariibaculum lutulentum TaxID=2920935 RepID=A0ABS9RFF2_9FLAO|nr:FecR family protein [Aestuariibaculum lutulentum]MCH4551683.1 FecR domain-containing protein [Aestuariibaculum lutulentum]
MKNKNKHIELLISKYISKEMSQKEFNELEQWLNISKENKTFFTDLLKAHKISQQIQFNEQVNTTKAWEKILSNLKNPITNSTKPINHIRWLKPQNVLKYAAAIILFISVGYYFIVTYSTDRTTLPTNQITLQLDNGSIKYINEDGTTEIKDTNGNIITSQNQGQLIYSGTAEEKLVYNTLTIPYGKHFQLKLSDGTTVHLNAGTSLKYPVKFIKGKSREVYLTGEAFFSVTKDPKHPFIVNAQNLDIKVLGTAFNVSAYTEDTITNVVLVEGAVEMFEESNDQKNKTRLKPGDKGTFNRTNTNIETEQVNTSVYTSWMQGQLFFRNMTFQNIVKKLERHFDIKIIVQNKQLNQETFNASFKDEPIENILNYFNKSFDINYTVKNNIIYIN